MSTQPPTTTTPTPTPTQTATARTTEPTPSRFPGSRDRWRADDDTEPTSAAAAAPRTFDPFCRYRLPNRIDDENQAMLRDRTRDATDAD